MPVSLQKGQKVSLTKGNPGLSKVVVGLGWDVNAFDTGAGEGDDEQIRIELSKVPENLTKIAFTATIYEPEQRRQNFGQVNNAFIRIYNEDTGEELLRYDLGEDFSIETAVVFGELYKNNGEWKFNAIGSGYQGGLAALCGNFGVDVE